MRIIIAMIMAFSCSAFAAGDDCTVYVVPGGTKDVTGSTVIFHNPKIEKLLEGGAPPAKVREAILLMIREGAFDIPVDETGFVPAADVGDHGGGYGQFLWLRDLARVYQGMAAYVDLLEAVVKTHPEFEFKLKEARAKIIRVSKAMVQVAGNSQWTEAAVNVIRNPGVALDEANGFRNVIWVRRMIAPFKENREPTREEFLKESHWAHKQNDGVGSFALSMLDAIERGYISPRDLSGEAKLNLHLLPAYFQRLQYWQMWDAGAWEELLGLRASSVAIVTGLLERLQTLGGFPEVTVPEDVRELVAASYRDIGATIGHGYDTLSRQLLNGARLQEAAVAAPHGTRFEDGAIYHVTWPGLDRFTVEHRAHILNGLKPLERASGIIRYTDDWFLYGAAEAARNAERIGLYGVLAIPNQERGGWKQASAADKAAIVAVHKAHEQDKYMAPVTALAGAGLEAGWTFFDAMAGTEYAKLYQETGRQDFRAQMLRHFQRMAGSLTGPGQITTEGKPVAPFRWPEAYIPVRVMVRGTPQIMYMVSPNSPLNWSVAEGAVLANQVWRLTQ